MFFEIWFMISSFIKSEWNVSGVWTKSFRVQCMSFWMQREWMMTYVCSYIVMFGTRIKLNIFNVWSLSNPMLRDEFAHCVWSSFFDSELGLVLLGTTWSSILLTNWFWTGIWWIHDVCDLILLSLYGWKYGTYLFVNLNLPKKVFKIQF